MDSSQALVDQVKAAFAADQPIAVHGGRSKDFLGAEFVGEPLDMTGHTGIVNYQPVELVMTVRAGTLLSDVKAALAENGQSLPFEPPGFGDTATIGGTIATGVSGPARPYTGSARDYVLGVRMINGQGEHLRFGGEVMKNVAGYDISRVMTASHGTLGAITEVSLKVLPVAKAETTLAEPMSAVDAVAYFNRIAGLPLPVTATAWSDGLAYVRLSGAASAVDAAVNELSGAPTEASPWTAFAELTHASVAIDAPLWRIS
ncbi:MAG: glycolate oxidase subunit GlcE, partial [Litorivicinus sp.]